VGEEARVRTLRRRGWKAPVRTLRRRGWKAPVRTLRRRGVEEVAPGMVQWTLALGRDGW